MIRPTTVIVLVALASSLASAQYAETCPSPRAVCDASAVAVASAVSTGGSCTVSSRATAFCNAFETDTQVCFFPASPFYNENDCRVTDIELDITCWSTAVATAFSSGFVRAECENQSIGCGLAVAEAQSETESIGCFVVQSLLDVAEGLNTATRECQVELINVKNVVVKAASEARAAACSTGGTRAVDIDIDFDAEARRVIGKAFGACWKYC